MAVLHRIAVAVVVVSGAALGQSQSELAGILARLERLEKDNRELREEVRALRSELAAARAPSDRATVDEKLAIHEARIAEHEQSKIGSTNRLPLKVTGMALFNLFGNGAQSNGVDNPVLASNRAGERAWGGTFRQTILGLQYDGVHAVLGGKVHGSIAMDFYSGSSQTLYNLFRVRTGDIGIDWGTRSVSFALDKPLFSPRNPTSYSQVGVSPLTAAGNLWRWQPQVRFEQRIGLGPASGLRGQAAFIQTSEDAAATGYNASGTNHGQDYELIQHERRRPGFEGRLEYWRRLDDTRRVEIASGFHFSNSLIAGQTLASNLWSFDWFANPWWSRLEFTGAFFSGQNIGHFGAPHAGYTLRYGEPYAVHSRGGWGQLTLLPLRRLSFNFFAGEHDDRNRDLLDYDPGLNRSGGANVVYQLAPNVLVSLEARQTRTTYLGWGRRLNNHYDLAVAYLF